MIVPGAYRGTVQPSLWDIDRQSCKCCGYAWYPREPGRPRVCPQCKSARWDVGRRVSKAPGETYYISKNLRFTVLQRDGFRCRYCGRAAPDVVLEVDHLHPRASGGTMRLENLGTACFDCNRGKRDRLVEA